MRALNISASAMKALQFNVDTISNNLANVNTTSYKKSRVEFKDLLYNTMQKGMAPEQNGRPVNTQAGNGVMVLATVKSFVSGNINPTENPLDLYIDGPGFFAVKADNDQIFYTRDGSFKLGAAEDGTLKLITSDGYSVLDSGDNEIFIDADQPKSISITGDGLISYINEDGTTTTSDTVIKMVKFLNTAGLESKGNNLYIETVASGEAISEEEEENANVRSVIKQGFLETSNVQVVDEMVNLITAQRAYEINSKAIQAADEMMQQANSLRR